MKKHLLILLFAIFFFNNKSIAQPWLDQYFDGADSSFTMSWGGSLLVKYDTAAGNIWQVGEPGKVIFDTAATFRNVLVTDTVNYYPVNNTSIFSFDIGPTWPANGILGIQWKQKLDMDKKRDGGKVEFSVDYGVTWQNAFNNPYVYNYFGFDPSSQDTLVTGDYALSGTDSTWKDIWLCYSLSWIATVVDSVKVRFTFVSDSIDNQKEGWMIDNLHAHLTITHPVKEEKKETYINVYPNPAKDKINIELQHVNGFHIIEKMELINAQGKIVEEWKTIPFRFWIDTSKYPSGNYFLKIKSNLKTETVPIIIQK